MIFDSAERCVARMEAIKRVRSWVRLFDNDKTTTHVARDAMRSAPPPVSLRAVAAMAAAFGAPDDAREINALACICETHALTWRDIDEAAS